MGIRLMDLVHLIINNTNVVFHSLGVTKFVTRNVGYFTLMIFRQTVFKWNIIIPC